MNWNLIKLISPLLLVSACAKEDPIPVSSSVETGKGVILSVSLPITETKTMLGEKAATKYPTLWKEGDCISLNGFSSLPLSAADAGGSSAAFIFRDGLASPFNLLYPATSEKEIVNFPYRQSYAEGTFDPEATPMWGSSLRYEDVSLNHLSSLLRISLSSSEGVSLESISLTALGGEALSGSFRLGKNADGTFNGSMSSVEGGNSLLYTFPSGGLVLGTTPSYAYVSIPAGSYSRGFKAVVHATDGKVMILSFFGDGRSVAPSKVLEFPDVAFVADSQEVLYISNADEFMSLTGSSRAILTADIDMSGKNWTSLNFSGSLDGLGHTVKGLSVPFASTLSGMVKDLNLATVLRDETASGITRGCLANTLAAAGRVSGCIFSGSMSIAFTTTSGSSFVGGLIGTAAADSQIKDCINQGQVTADGVTAGALTLGGVVGRLQSNGENIVNRGKVTFGQNSKASTLYLGGAIGNHNSSGTVSGAGNEGSVICSGSVTGEAYIGGVMGANSQGELNGIVTSAKALVECDCTEKSAVKPHVGGVVGHLTLQASVKNCKNHTPIRFLTRGEVHTFLSIGGIAGYYNRSDSNSMTAVLDGCENYASIVISGNLVGKSAAVTEQGNVAGIIGYGYLTGAGTHRFEVKNCTNYGNITFDGDITYVRAAGIIGGTNLANSVFEGNCNRGNLAVTGAVNGQVIGGVIASMVAGNTLTKCKNAGDIPYGGLISGTSPHTAVASYCGVGGRQWDGENWTAPLVSDFPKFIYAGWAPADYASYPEFYVGCSYWDGQSKLNWED